MITFKIAVGYQDIIGWDFKKFVEVDGFYAFEMFGFQWMAHNDNQGSFDDWEISELSTGMRIPFTYPAFTMEQAIERAKKFLEDKGESLTKQRIDYYKEILLKV